MSSEKRSCQNCKEEFTIDPEDFIYYQKIEVPPPTFCPDCRLQRRMAWRNERTLYSRICSATNDKIVSYYHSEVPFPVYKREYWYSDKWNPLSYGKEYDFEKPFFEQFAELFKSVPRIQNFLVNSENSDYTSYTVESKNCYLCFTALGGNENCSYSSYLTTSTDCMDCHLITKCDSCYECVNCEICYNVKYSIDSTNCRDSWFLNDCSNCNDCFGCVGLSNVKYYIFNEQHSKEEYEKKISDLLPTSTDDVRELRKKLAGMNLKKPKKFMHGKKNQDVSGDYIYESKNCTDSYLINKNEDCRYTFYSSNSKDYYDVFISFLSNETVYESHAIPKSNYFLKFCDLCANGNRNIEYCDSCESSSYLFGCIGLKGTEYCILNKQYSKEEYEALIPKIKKHMNDMPYTDKKGRIYKYGEFFPIELSPFGYNESTAQDYFPHSDEQIKENGYLLTDIGKHKGTHTPTLTKSDMPKNMKYVGDEILKEVLECANASEKKCAGIGAFKFTKAELEFYKKHKLPLPQLCPNCRQLNRINQRNPRKLTHRQCMCDYEVYDNSAKHQHHPEGRCPNEFKTTYSSDRKEIVYCEQCYQTEVI